MDDFDFQVLKSHLEQEVHHYYNRPRLYRDDPLICVFGFANTIYYLYARHREYALAYKLVHYHMNIKLDINETIVLEFEFLSDLIKYVIGQSSGD